MPGAFVTLPQPSPGTPGVGQPLPPPIYPTQQPVRVINVDPRQAGARQLPTQQPGVQFQARPVGTPAPQQYRAQQAGAQYPAVRSAAVPAQYQQQTTPAPQQYHAQQAGAQYPAVRAAAAPAQYQQQQQQQYAVVQPSATVTVCDLTKARPRTAEEARDANTEYYVCRLTRVDSGNGYDSDGTRKKPSWKRVESVLVPGISTKQARRLVQQLNRQTIPVADKKSSLSSDEQRQIELVLEALQQKHDNDWFETTLVQLEDQVTWKPEEKDRKDRPRGRESDRERDRQRDKYHKEYTLRDVRASSKTPSRLRDSRRTIPERVSLTVYFKRAPRSNVDPFTIPNQQDLQMAGMQLQPYVQPVARPDGGYYSSTPRVIQAGGVSQRHHTQAGYPRGRGVAVVQVPASARHARTPGWRPSRSAYNGDPNSPSTDESVYSEGFSAQDDDETDCTSPASSSYLSSRDSFDRVPRKSRPAHYGGPTKFPSGRGPVIQPHQSNLRGRSASVPRHATYPHQHTREDAFFNPRPGTGPAPNHFPQGAVPHPQGHHIPPAVPGAPVHHPHHQQGGPMPPPPLTIPNRGGGGPQQPGGMPMNMMPNPNNPNRPGVNNTGMPLQPALDPKQIYANGQAAGRAEIREEAMAMASRMAERVVASAAAHPPPVVVQQVPMPMPQQQQPRGRSRSRERNRERDGSRESRGRGRGRRDWSSSRSSSGSRSRSGERRDDGGGRRRGGRSSSLDRAERGARGGGYARGRSASLEKGGRGREYERHGRERSRERRDLRDRGRSGSLDRRYERSRPGSPRGAPRSGVRTVQPATGYARPRVGLDREGLEREMDRLSLADDRREPYGPRRDGQYRGGEGTRVLSDRDRGLDPRTERLRDERVLRDARARREQERRDEDRERDRRERDDFPRRGGSKVDGGPAPFAAGNPFASRPGLMRRAGTANLTGRDNEFIQL